MSGSRVVVTGVGLVTSLGVDRESTWAALCAGRSGTRFIRRFDASRFATRIANEIPAVPLAAAVAASHNGGGAEGEGLCGQILRLAIDEALRDAGIERSALGPDTGIFIGTTAGAGAMPDDYRSEHFFGRKIENNGSIWPALAGYGDCPRLAIATACASSAHAVALAYDMVRSGQVDSAIVGGAEASITPFAIASFNSMLALSMRNEDPERASRPFDRNRDGFVMGDGAGVMILEQEPLASSRCARAYAELLGYGMVSEASSMAVPLEGGVGMARSMQAALASARLTADQIDYISAHGTSTPANDRCETNAIKKVFGAQAFRLAVSSQKSMIGHTIGAAGAIELAITALSLHRGIVTPTINYEEPDPECDLFYTPNVTVERQLRYALSNSFAFGGHNCTLAVGRYRG